MDIHPFAFRNVIWISNNLFQTLAVESRVRVFRLHKTKTHHPVIKCFKVYKVIPGTFPSGGAICDIKLLKTTTPLQ